MGEADVISLSNVDFGYDGELVLAGVNLSITERDFAWIVGPNGGGKTTLLKLMVGLLRPKRGTVRVFGGPPQRSGSRIGYLPQSADLDPEFPVTAADVVFMGRLGGGIKLGPFRKKDREVVDGVMSEVGLHEMRDRPFSDLSGGQRRRLLIARALACRPDLLLLDEPTANLDFKMEEELYELLHRLNERLTIVMVSHDPAFVSESVKSVVCVNRNVSVHPTSEVSSEFMGHLYGGGVRMVRHDRHMNEKKPHD